MDSSKGMTGNSSLETCIQEHLFGLDGFLNDVSIIFIDKTDPFDLLRQESFWRQTLKRVAPYGLNI